MVVDACLPGSPKERKSAQRWLNKNGPFVATASIVTIVLLWLLFGRSSSDVTVTSIHFTSPDRNTGPDLGAAEPTVPTDTDSDVKLGVAVVSDEDEDNVGHDITTDQRHWKSKLCKGVLSRKNGRYSVHWNTHCPAIHSKINYAGRGFELSELIRFAGR